MWQAGEERERKVAPRRESGGPVPRKGEGRGQPRAGLCDENAAMSVFSRVDQQAP